MQDVAYFIGETAPVELRAGNPGYDYDGMNADVLLHEATVKDGRLTLASGANYAMLILPPDDIPAPQEIPGGWMLSFPPNWGAPPSVKLKKLIS